MSAIIEKSDKVISSKSDLVDWIEGAAKPRSEWRIGTEHEKLVFHNDTMKPVAYLTRGGFGIADILQELAKGNPDWSPLMEGENIVGLVHDQKGSITLEPGGQFELSGAPLTDLHSVSLEISDHIAMVRRVCAPMGIGMVGFGYDPLNKLSDLPWMPKERYRIMRSKLRSYSADAEIMMPSTATVQVNLDFSSEQDMRRKYRVGLGLHPLVSALFANSPFRHGAVNKGVVSERLRLWLGMDLKRSGILREAYEDGFGYEKWVDHIINVPMLFEDDRATFADFMAGKLPGRAGQLPTFSDWNLHLTTIFTDVRLKRFFEMRGADVQRPDYLCGLPAFWVGILYDDGVLSEVNSMIKHWRFDEVVAMRNAVPFEGLAVKTPDGEPLLDFGKRIVALAERGLSTRALKDSKGNDESIHLHGIKDVLDKGKTRSEQLVEMLQDGRYKTLENLIKAEAYF